MKSLLPFLKMGTIFTSLQSPGKMLSRKDLLNNMVNDCVIWLVVSFSRCARIPSDPVTFT